MPDPTGRVSHLPEMHRGVSWKQPVRAASTASGTLGTDFANGDTVDGVTLATGDRILIKNQSTASQNGIYLVTTGTPTRAFDMDQDATDGTAAAEEVLGSFVYVLEGTTNGGTLWYTTNTGTPTLGSTSINWSQFSGESNDTSYVEANAGTAYTIDVSVARTYDLTLNSGTAVLSLTGAVNNEAWFATVMLRQDGTGNRLVTWPGAVTWPGGTTPTLGTAASNVDVFTLFSVDGGTVWFGFEAGGGSGTATLDWAETADIANIGTAAYSGSIAEVPYADHVHALTADVLEGIGHYEVIVSGTAPPVAVTNPAEDDWVYGWLSG